MAARIEPLDTVAMPTLGLAAREVGAVVEILGDGEAFEVEFRDNSGITYGLHTLGADQLVAPHGREQALRLSVEAV